MNATAQFLFSIFHSVWFSFVLPCMCFITKQASSGLPRWAGLLIGRGVVREMAWLPCRGGTGCFPIISQGSGLAFQPHNRVNLWAHPSAVHLRSG